MACLKVPCQYSPVRLKKAIENRSYDYLVILPGFDQLPPENNSVPPSNLHL